MLSRKVSLGSLTILSLASACVQTEPSAIDALPLGVSDCASYPASGDPPPVVLTLDNPVPEVPAASGPYHWQNVTIQGGGFVSGIVFSRAAPNVIYARTDVGGAYRFDIDAGRWVPLTDWISATESNLMGIESIAADPLDPSRVYLAAGTYLNAGPGEILRSSDYGRTWERHRMGLPMGGNVNGRSMGERLAVDPHEPSTLYFGSRQDGLWSSRDAGVSWSRVTSFPVTGARELGISFVLFDEQTGVLGRPTPRIFVGVARLAEDDANQLSQAGNDPSNPADALYWSEDAGQSWQAVPGQPSEMMPHHAALDTAGVLYLTYSDRPGPNDIRSGAVHRLVLGSGQWTDISPPKPGGRGGFAGLGVDASSPGTVMVSTLDVWSPDEIYRSTSSGNCWTAIGPRAIRDAQGAEWVRFGQSAPNSTGWMGDFEIDPHNPSRALYITGQGIWWSDDVTAADHDQFTHWVFANQGLEETVALDLQSPPDGAPLLSAVGDIAGFRHDDLRISPPAGMFDNPRFSNTSSIDFAALAPAQVLRVGTGGPPRGAASRDGGQTWTPFASEPSGGTGQGSIAIAADGSTWLWDPQGTGPHYSRDQGASWTASSGLPMAMGGGGGGGGSSVSADRVNPSKFYVRTQNAVFISSDGGASFTQAASGLGGGGRLRPVFGIEGDLWLANGQGLFHSLNSGASFERSAGINVGRAIGFGRAAPDQSYPALYLAGNLDDAPGLFRSDDGGATWLAIDDVSQKFGFVSQITGDPQRYGRVYIGTGGRGVLFGDPR